MQVGTNRNLNTQNLSFGDSRKVITSSNIGYLGKSAETHITRAAEVLTQNLPDRYRVSMRAIQHSRKSGFLAYLAIDVEKAGSPVQKLVLGVKKLLGITNGSQRQIFLPPKSISASNIEEKVNESIKLLIDRDLGVKLAFKMKHSRIGEFSRTKVDPSVPEFLGNKLARKVISKAAELNNLAKLSGHFVRITSNPESKELYVAVTKNGAMGLSSIDLRDLNRRNNIKDLMQKSYLIAVSRQQELAAKKIK